MCCQIFDYFHVVTSGGSGIWCTSGTKRKEVNEAGKGEKCCGKFVLVYLIWVDVVFVNVYYIIKNNNDELPPYSEQI